MSARTQRTDGVQTRTKILRAELVVETGRQQPSPFAAEFIQVATLLQEQGVEIAAEQDSLSAELECLREVPAGVHSGTAFLEIREHRDPTLESHGIAVGMWLPVNMPNFQKNTEYANELNRLESDPEVFTRAHQIGGWAARDDENGPSYRAFLPTLAYQPGIMLLLLSSMGQRARFVGDLLTS